MSMLSNAFIHALLGSCEGKMMKKHVSANALSIKSTLKLKYLEEHLIEVEGLIREWRGQLDAPQGVEYSPAVEEDLDKKRILKSHLRSRRLWHHHADWERQLRSMWELMSRLRRKIAEEHPKWSAESEFVNTALKAGFAQASGEVSRKYHRVDSQLFWAHTPIGPASNEAESEHWALIQELAKGKEMTELVSIGSEIKRLERQMKTLIDEAVKSKDILYPCRFCRHLWKD